MKKLSRMSQFDDFYLNHYEKGIDVSFPIYFSDFLKKYAGYSIIENEYVDKSNTSFKIHSFCEKNDRILKDYAIGIKAKGMGLKIPFAFDSSQKAYCLCLDESDYGAVYLFTLTGTWNNVDGTLEKICDSFFEFINSLQNEIVKHSNSQNNSDVLKELTIIGITDDEVKKIESKLGFSLPNYYVEFMKIYANSSVYENTFNSKNGKKFILASFCTYSMIEARVDEYFEEVELEDENLFKNIGLQLPFAIDGGGYRFCISLNEKTFGQIFFLMEELLSIDEQSAHVFLANSLEEFIDALQPEDSVV